MSEEIKVVITLKGDRGCIGVQAPNCDPVFAILEGGLDAALGRVATLVEEARQRWAESARYPKCESPLPSQTARPSQTPPPAHQPARPAQREATTTTMQRMF